MIGNAYSLTGNTIKQILMLLPGEKIFNVLSRQLGHKENMKYIIFVTNFQRTIALCTGKVLSVTLLFNP